MRSLAAVLLTLLAIPGCARYEYDILQPPDLARHIGTKSDIVVRQDPLEYRLRTVDNRLVMRIHNPTQDPIMLLGPQSSVVDPQGQSHPLRTQTIAPQSFIKLIFPPLRPRVERVGPSIGIGVGGTFGGRYRRHYEGVGYDQPFYDDEPRYLAVVDDDALYWDWRGQGQMRLTLVFDRGGQTLRHQFVIGRKKM